MEQETAQIKKRIEELELTIMNCQAELMELKSAEEREINETMNKNRTEPANQKRTEFGNVPLSDFIEDICSKQDLTVTIFNHGYCTFQHKQKSLTCKTEDLELILGRRIRLEKTDKHPPVAVRRDGQ